MPFRYQGLQEALTGLGKTGISLVAYDGNILKPAGFSDDVGIYYVIPKIAYTFNISIDQSMNLFFIGLVLVSWALGIIGSFLLFRTWLSRVVAFVGLLLLSLIVLKVGDVYLVPPSVAVAIVPFFLFFAKDKPFNISFVACIFLSGIGIGTAHYLRSHAGTAVVIFIVSLLILYCRMHRREKLILAAALGAGVLVPIVYFQTLLDRRDAYLMSHYPEHRQVLRHHVFWHSVYIGLGFLNNTYGIQYLDEVAIEKVRSISPDVVYLSQEYETTLRNEVLRLMKDAPLFVLTNVFAKIGVISFYLLVFANVGLLTAVLHPKTWSLELAFWIGMAFNALFGILIIPNPPYLLGFIAFATLYGIVSINHTIESGVWRDRLVKITA
ncbi:MAG: hypothetical protein HY709_12300, partial [Candidatus Latescibacteria bacterium]|nr:hypothetical protein [Candidatus Latescibacterota bacterium]